MKILLATSSFSGGGITSYAKEVIKAFAENNDVEVLLGDDSYSPIEGKVHYFDCSDLSYDNASAVIALINDEIKPDVIIGSNACLIPLIAPYLLDSISVITVSHSQKYYEADISVWNSKYLDNVIALSENGKRYLAGLCGCAEKITIIPNFVHDKANADDIVRGKNQSAVFTIVYPGGASSCKSPEISVRVINGLLKTDLPFRIICLGGTTIQSSSRFPILKSNDIKDYVSDDPRVEFLGKVPRAEALSYIENANVFLFPSLREGCSIAILEAIRTGAIPVVADYDNSNKEIVRDGYNGYVVGRNDIQGFVDAIVKVYSSTEGDFPMYENSRQSYLSDFTYDIWKARMLSVIEKSFANHAKRKVINRARYLLDMLLMKGMIVVSKVCLVLNEDLKVILSFRKLKTINH